MTSPFDKDERERKELAAMAEVGLRRERAGSYSFAVAWVLTTGGMMLFGMGIFPGMLLSAGLALAMSRAYVAWRTEAIIARVAEERGVPEVALSRDEYIVD